MMRSSHENPEADDLVAPDGSTYVDSQLGDRIYALDRSLEPRAGWPYVIPGPRVYPGISDGGTIQLESTA